MTTTLRRRRAGDIRNRRPGLIAGLLSVVMCLTLAPAVPASANGTVDWDAQQARDRLFSAYMRIHATGTQGLRDMVLSVATMDWRRANPNASTADISRHMALINAELDEHATADVYGAGAYSTLVTLIDAASGVPGVSIATPALRALLESTVGEQLAQTAAIENQVTGAYQTNMYLTALYGVQDHAWGEVTRFGQNDAAFTAAWNGMIGGRAGVILDASIDQLQADPLLATYVDVEALLLHQNNMNDYLAEIRRQVEAGLASLNAQNDQIREQLAALSLKYPVGPGPKPTAQDYTRALGEAADRQVVLDAAGSGLFILATLAGFADKDLGNHISTVGKAGLAIATAINNYLPTVAGLGVAQALGSLSTLALTGNILGAVMSVLPMFASGPSPEQMILDQLAALRADVNSLRTEMHGRFDAIERALSVVYVDMMGQFDRLFQDIGQVRGQLTDIQARLLQLDTKLDSLALFTARALQTTTLTPMRTAINGYVNYEKRTGGPMSYDKYSDDAEIPIHFGTTGLSRLEPMASTSASFGDDPITILNRYGPGGSLSYLIWLANARYGAGLAEPGNTAPSSGVFQLGGRAYAALQLQNPEHARRIGKYRADEVRQIGTDHLNAARVLSSSQDGTPNRVFTQLISEYRQDVANVNAELVKVRDRITDKAYNPFGAADANPTTRVAGPGTLPICSGYGLSRATPTNAFQGMPNVFHNATIVLPANRKPTFSGCWSAEWADMQGDPTETWAANLEVTIRVRAQWPGQPVQEIRTLRAKRWYGNVCVYNYKTETQTCKFANTVAQDNWNTYKTLLEQSATSTSVPAQVTEATRQVEAGFHGKIRQYYDAVNHELRTATPLEQKKRRLAETIALLRAYTEVAFPKALAGNATLSSLLFGSLRIPGDYSALPGAAAPDRTSMSDAYARAALNYAGCEQAGAGAPCQLGFSPNVRKDQVAPYDTACTAAAGSTGDHVSNCLTALSGSRADQLAAQYVRHFREVKDGVYVEGSPEVEALVAELETVDRVNRAG